MIIIPMAGLSSRFTKAGYAKPKYQLKIGGRSVFDLAVSSFKNYFNDEKIVFVIRDICDTKDFIQAELVAMDVHDYDIIELENETRGQAETVYLACKEFDEESSITIFNIDTFRYGFEYPPFVQDCAGYLEVFRGEGEHWSFVGPIDEVNVAKTTEKERISDLCSNGLYYFQSKKEFERLFEKAEANNCTVKGEFYIAPLYNLMIKEGGVVKYSIVEPDQLDFCGTPAEYEDILLRLKSAEWSFR